MEGLDWPAQSHDLNPTEHLWVEVESPNICASLISLMLLLLRFRDSQAPKSCRKPSQKSRDCFTSRLSPVVFEVRFSTIIYGCNVPLSTYFWPCAVHDRCTAGITATLSSIHSSFTSLLMQTMSINVLYLPPHLLHFLSCDPLLSSCGVICSAGSRRLDSMLCRPTQVPAGFICYAAQHLKGLFFWPPTFFIFSFTPSTHIRLISPHLMALFYSCL